MASRSLEFRQYHSTKIAVLAWFHIYGGSHAWHVFTSMAYNWARSQKEHPKTCASVCELWSRRNPGIQVLCQQVNQSYAIGAFSRHARQPLKTRNRASTAILAQWSGLHSKEQETISLASCLGGEFHRNGQCCTLPDDVDSIRLYSKWSGAFLYFEKFSILGVDLTFNLGEFDVIVTTYRHLVLQSRTSPQPPVMLRPMFIHVRKDFAAYHFFTSALVGQRLHLIFKGFWNRWWACLGNALKATFPMAQDVRCFLHFQYSIKWNHSRYYRVSKSTSVQSGRHEKYQKWTRCSKT